MVKWLWLRNVRQEHQPVGQIPDLAGTQMVSGQTRQHPDHLIQNVPRQHHIKPTLTPNTDDAPRNASRICQSRHQTLVSNTTRRPDISLLAPGSLWNRSQPDLPQPAPRHRPPRSGCSAHRSGRAYDESARTIQHRPALLRACHTGIPGAMEQKTRLRNQKSSSNRFRRAAEGTQLPTLAKEPPSTALWGTPQEKEIYVR
jgi:hypothetical protein